MTVDIFSNLKTSKECREAKKHLLHSYVNRHTDYCYICEREYSLMESERMVKA